MTYKYTSLRPLNFFLNLIRHAQKTFFSQTVTTYLSPDFLLNFDSSTNFLSPIVTKLQQLKKNDYKMRAIFRFSTVTLNIIILVMLRLDVFIPIYLIDKSSLLLF